MEVVGYESLLKFRQPSADEMNMEEFLGLVFSHHIEILHKTKTLVERLLSTHEAVTYKWDKYLLSEMLKGKLYEHQGEMPGNFAKTM